MFSIAYQNIYGKVIAPTNGISSKFFNLETGLPAIYDAALFGAIIIFLVLMIVGGIQYLASAGGDGTAKAKKLLQASVVGFILVFGTWAIMAFLFRLVSYQF